MEEIQVWLIKGKSKIAELFGIYRVNILYSVDFSALSDMILTDRSAVFLISI